MASEKSPVAQIIVESLYNAGVRVVFGIPGAKIDAIFDTLSDHPEIHLVVCRHEQNAAMMAAAVGRITGTPGVCIATSGPGAGNLTTGLLTATTEGDPVVALVGSVPRCVCLLEVIFGYVLSGRRKILTSYFNSKFCLTLFGKNKLTLLHRLLSTKHTHQAMQALDVLSPVSKFATNVDVEDQAAETILAAFRKASTSPKGASVVSIPMDVAAGKSAITAFPSEAFPAPPFGPSPEILLQKVARMIESARMPVLFLGMRASSEIVVTAGTSIIPLAYFT